MIRLQHRALLLLKGPDTLPLMQGLITNDVRILDSGKAIAAYLLNTKGRIVEDLILWRRSDDLLLECSSSTRGDLKKTLEKYRMRKKVAIVESDEPVCFSPENGDCADPRVSSLGFRSFGKTSKDDLAEYHKLRRKLGVAEGAEEVSGLLPFQCNGDLLNMISLDKGCYIGQELTARTAHTGVIRRRVLPFTCDASPTGLTGPVTNADNKKIGEVISYANGSGLAILSLSAVSSQLRCGDTAIKPFRPAFMPEETFRNESL